MAELPESQAAFCKRIGLSANKFRQIERGEPGTYRKDTLVKVSLGLWKRPDAIDRILAGDPPVPIVQSLEFPDGTTIEFEGGTILHEKGDRVVALVSFPRDDPRLAHLLELYPEADRAARLEEKVALLEQMVLDAQDLPERGDGGAVLHMVGKGSGKSVAATAAKQAARVAARSGKTKDADAVTKAAKSTRKVPSKPQPPPEDDSTP